MFVEKYVYKTQISWKEEEKKNDFFVFTDEERNVRKIVSI